MNFFKKLKLFLLILVCIQSSIGFSKGNKPLKGGEFGLGIMAGDPNGGISLKYWKTKKTAIDAAIGWSLGSNIHLHGDYLIHDYDIIKVEKGLFPIYYGIGGFIRSHKELDYIGVRFPVGFAYMLATHPLEFFMELVARLSLVPSTNFDLGLAVGGRYYF